MNNTRDIRRRIKSVTSTKKITRAMEMVSAAKMRRSVNSVLQIRSYAHSAWNVLTNLARAFEEHPVGLLEVRPVRCVLTVLVTSNRGLCGAFNAQIYKKLRQEIENPEKLMVNRVGMKRIEPGIKKEELVMDFIAVGKKGEGMLRRMSAQGGSAFGGGSIIATFPELTYFPTTIDIRPLSKIVIDDYLAKKYDKVVILYTDFVSAIRQETKIRQLLPISRIDLEKQIAEMDNLAKEYGLEETAPIEYKVEPKPEEVLQEIIPRLIEMQVYHAVLESNASKESARMMAMRSATDAAGEMIDDLTLAYNQIRQMKITQEIAEISAGKAALE